MTKELFQRYLDGLCTPAEAKEVEAWLHTGSEASLDKIMQERWKREGPSMSRSQTAALWQRIAPAEGQRKPARGRIAVMRYVRMAAAVAVGVLLIITAGWLLQRQPVTPVARQQAPQQQTAPLPAWKYIENTGPGKKRILLADGSSVLLWPNSTVKYLQHFEPLGRNIYLEGKARFSVAKDEKRPFTVYSGEIAATALGTEFTVSSLDKARVTVQLHEGKVLVKAYQGGKAGRGREAVLAPGEQFTCNRASGAILVNRFDAKAKNSSRAKAADESSSNALVFNNTPLQVVFKKLEQRYHVPIRYRQQDIAGICFTATLDETDSLHTVLSIIAQMNKLEVKEEGNGITVANPEIR